MDILTSTVPPVNGSVSATQEKDTSPGAPRQDGAAPVATTEPVAGAVSEQNPSSSTGRAEILVDQLGEKVSRLASCVGTNFLYLTAHVREAFEDFWAETQNVRFGKRS